jgi:ribosomal-protein-serine acetyltransferase
VSAWPQPSRLIVVDDDTLLQPVFEVPAATIYDLVARNRAYLGRYLDFATPEYALNHAQGYADLIRQNWGQSGEQSYAIMHSGTLAGVIGLHHYGARNRAVEIGYWLDAELQGRGIMTRCVLKLTGEAFERLNAMQVNISADVSNVRSRTIAERIGFKLDGISRKWLLNAAGDLADMARYSMLREEWTGTLK